MREDTHFYILARYRRARRASRHGPAGWRLDLDRRLSALFYDPVNGVFRLREHWLLKKIWA